MIKNIFLFFLFLSITSYGQVKLEGIVKDSLKAPLESASLVAIDQKTNNLESYVLTDINGKYKLNLKNNSNYNESFRNEKYSECVSNEDHENQNLINN